ncbi:hypothetical protein GMOD_00002686 [Pyrenophora seminiperda CCB06]|uniref:DUF7888 domain-containing protein n=1 Tax=Pyrenophora seminiperda CCB06 TaxID=1302712 RepID=A0A3M7M2X0_9PLEO|nr:hypothetical protein GMOD_00002686 [Pyrenophora seminiperda CCB06]
MKPFTSQTPSITFNMRFTLPVILLAATVANAVAIPTPSTAALQPLDLQPREPGASAQVILDHSGDAGLAVGRIINSLLNKLFPIKDWNPARETFTKETTALMWQNNPNRNRWVAVACYNKGWSVKDRGAISDVVSVELKLGALHTDYDCVYIGRGNQFYTEGDGGYDGRTGDLTCN